LQSRPLGQPLDLLGAHGGWGAHPQLVQLRSPVVWGCGETLWDLAGCSEVWVGSRGCSGARQVPVCSLYTGHSGTDGLA
jgi:hypothetical protein